MTSPMDRSARLARYATAGAIAPVTAIGGLAHADVYSGSFTDLTLTATSGTLSIGAGFTQTFSGTTYYGSGQRLTGGSFSGDLGGLNLSFLADRFYGFGGYYSQAWLTIEGGSQTEFLKEQQVASAGQTFNQVAYTGSNAGSSQWSFNLFNRSTFVGSKNRSSESGSYYTMFVSNEGDVDAKYGWISFSWSFTDYDNWAISVDEWAWSDDGPLAAGATDDGGATPVPGLGGLAALACGAAGVRGRRRRVA